jgi:hypothetical protein
MLVGMGRLFAMHCLPAPLENVPVSSEVQQKNPPKENNYHDRSAQVLSASTVAEQSAPMDRGIS